MTLAWGITFYRPSWCGSTDMECLRSTIMQTLTHWGRVTHICVNKLTIIGSDKGLPPIGRQAIIWTNDWILLIRTSGTNCQWNLKRNACIFIQENASESVVCTMTAILSRPQCVNSLRFAQLCIKGNWKGFSYCREYQWAQYPMLLEINTPVVGLSVAIYSPLFWFMIQCFS